MLCLDCRTSRSPPRPLCPVAISLRLAEVLPRARKLQASSDQRQQTRPSCLSAGSRSRALQLTRGPGRLDVRMGPVAWTLGPHLTIQLISCMCSSLHGRGIAKLLQGRNFGKEGSCVPLSIPSATQWSLFFLSCSRF